MSSSRKLCLLSLLLIGSDALSMPNFPDASVRPRAVSKGAASFQPIVLDNIQNLRYATNITVNGRQFRVLVDTGSSDLYIKTSKDFEFNDTGISMVNEYGGGPVSGTIGFATVEIGGYSFANQAFNNATSIGVGDITNLGLDGLIGLAFDSNSNSESDIQNALKDKHKNDTLGEPFLFNIFHSTPQQDNFIGISLSRTDDLEGSAHASMTINEVDLNYLDIVTSPEVPLFPGTNGRWSVLVDSISVNNVSITLPASTVHNTTPGKVVALLDTGTENFMLPAKLLNAIYSAITGSIYNSESMTWTIPCNTTSMLAIEIGGQTFPIHPSVAVVRF